MINSVQTIIADTFLACNNYFESAQTHASSRITRTQHRILTLLREYHDAYKPFFLGNAAIAQRFGLSESTISRHMSDLKDRGLVHSEHCGSNAHILCITLAGFNVLAGEPSTQSSTQIYSIPYYDLSKKERDLFKIFKENENCGKPEDIDIPIEKQLDLTLEKIGLNTNEREGIKFDIKHAKIGAQRAIKLIRRVVEVSIKKPIQNIRAYFRKALCNETRQLAELTLLFRRKGMTMTMYSTDYINYYEQPS